MNFFDVLFTVLIKPLELIFEGIFAVSHDIIPNPAVNLVIMSLAINFLVLPLYRRADIIQMEARDKEEKIRPMADHIRKHFKGDEKVMMLQIYYEQRHYHPLSSLKSIISLLLQIPFFIAAYQFLSHLPLLEGERMGPINDLLAPDGLLVLGSVTINVLPIIMTVVNIISSEIYTKGQPFKSKIVLYLSALIFLVLLYDSPSGLVFYWTFNNVFSLVKNIFYRLKNPGFVFKILLAVSGIAGVVYTILNRSQFTTGQLVFLFVLSGALIVPLILHLITKKIKLPQAKPVTPAKKILYWVSVIYLTALTGFLIPSAVVVSSPDDFIQIADLKSPALYIWYTLFIAAGVFIVWTSVFYLLATDKGRGYFALAALMLSVVATVDYLFFSTNLGTLSPELELDDGLKLSTTSMLINAGVVLAALAAAYCLYRFIPQITRFVVIALTIVAVGMSIYNIAGVTSVYNGVASRTEASGTPEIALSKTGKNVVVIMLDRALNSLVPYLFNENSTVKKQFEGFTYYPNTISFGAHTNFGAPGLFGGYEYTPENINKRTEEKLVDKHNEALLVMPVIFSNSGYTTTAIDMPYVNYSEVVDMSIFSDYPDINAYMAYGLNNPYNASLVRQADETRERNFFCYSLFKIVPVFLQEPVYDGGNYHSLGVKYNDEEDVFQTPQTYVNQMKATGTKTKFLNAYYVLEDLSKMTKIEDSDKGCFFVMSNDTTHAPVLLQTPDYVPANEVDNTMYDLAHTYRVVLNGRMLRLNSIPQMTHYHSNMAAYNSLGRWFDYLREQGVWDNTRIILVSDHGYNLGHFDDLIIKEYDLDIEYVNSLLMVKDFGSDEFTECRDFMTVADVPTLAMDGVIDDPVNPFTGKKITNEDKSNGPAHVFLSEEWHVTSNNGNVFLPGDWYEVSDDIFDHGNWKYIGEY
ncbi:membrane protein insertase, YidC/Oxa1 family, C-terminal domain-containing protein [Ruminococcaceae bacterium YRB3002]|nr:membrane protein insertase, YidC/Oxa1 family, C-terminal domain-containing protein [Ruminococcaceae bacterium YRB3002]